MSIVCRALLALPASLALKRFPNSVSRSLLRQPRMDFSGDEMRLMLRELPEFDALSEWDEPILSVNWIDLDGDSLPDLFVGAQGGAKAIFQNTGKGNFSRFDAPHCGQYFDPPRPTHVHLTDCQHISRQQRESLVENTGVQGCPYIFNASPFWPSASVPCIAKPFEAQGAVWADFNNDGTQDYYQTLDGVGAGEDDTATRNAFFLNRGGHMFGGRRGGIVTGTDAFKAKSRMATVGDFNGDGRLDILLLNEKQDREDLSTGTQSRSVLLMQKPPAENLTTYTPVFEERALDLGLDTRKWQQPCDAEDVEPEITAATMANLRSHSGGITRLLMQTRCALHLYQLDEGKFRFGLTQSLKHSLPCPVLLGDVDNFAATIEGVTCENTASMSSINVYSSLFDLVNGTEPIDRVEATTANGTIIPAAMADFDNDGDLDILAVEIRAWRNEASGSVSHEHSPGAVPEGSALLHLIASHHGKMRVAQTYSINLTSWDLQKQAVAVADYNGDGKMDVVIGDSKRLHLWENAGPNQSWACVKPMGVKANAGGVGAIVKFAADNLVIRRDVVGPASHWQDNTRAVCAGLGEATTLQFIEICWPGPEPICEKWRELGLNRVHHLTQFKGEQDEHSNVTADA